MANKRANDNGNQAALDADAGVGIVVKNGAAVNQHCPWGTDHHVYSGPDNNGKTAIWDLLGSQTNIATNANKYYVLQLLEGDQKQSYAVYTRWGRVGKAGQSLKLGASGYCPPGTDLETCLAEFKSKFKSKTGYNWEDRDTIKEARKNKYLPVAINYGAPDSEEDAPTSKRAKKEKPVVIPDSKLKAPVQSLMKLIFDLRKFSDAVVEMRYDVNKSPLGKLTDEQLRLGMEALKAVESAIRGTGEMTVQDACNLFYTRVPHDFGMRRPPTIATIAEVKEKYRLLELLGDIKLTMTMLKEEDTSIHPDDRNFKQLDTGLKPLPAKSKERQMIKDYISNSHGSTHTGYTLELEEAFEVQKAGLPCKDTGKKRMLLWHGSRLSNWSGILQQGLKIAPPEAPVTGYMFGKGVYFADSVSKSANYCFADQNNNTGLLLLCDVEVGETADRLEIYDADNMLHEQFPRNSKLCTHGFGREGPDPAGDRVVKGVTVPCGKMAKTGRANPTGGFTLQYNEYVVYDLAQIKLKYLVRVKFNYDGGARW